MYVLCDSHLKSLVHPKNTCPQKVFHGDRCCLQGARPTYNPFLGQWPFVGCKDKLLHLPHLQYHGNSNWWFSWGHRHPIWYISIIFRDHMAALKKNGGSSAHMCICRVCGCPFLVPNIYYMMISKPERNGCGGPLAGAENYVETQSAVLEEALENVHGGVPQLTIFDVALCQTEFKTNNYIYYIFYIIIYVIYRSILYII